MSVEVHVIHITEQQRPVLRLSFARRSSGARARGVGVEGRSGAEPLARPGERRVRDHRKKGGGQRRAGSGIDGRRLVLLSG